MKKRYCYHLLLAVLLILTGCSTGDAAAASGFSREDLQLEIGGSVYRCNMDIQEIIGDLGEGYTYSDGMSCDYDGLDKTFAYDMAIFYTNPLTEGDMINEIYTQNPGVTTSRGIAVGSTKADILEAYGEECEDEGDLITYRVEGERATLCFEIEDDTVWAIYLTTQSV